MRTRAVYALTCLCGQAIETEAAQTTCPACRITIKLEWRDPEERQAEPRGDKPDHDQ